MKKINAISNPNLIKMIKLYEISNFKWIDEN